LNKLALGLLACAVAHAHVVSISNGELHVTGRSATFELRIPAYEVETVANPEIALLDELRFAGATRTGSQCRKEADWLTCNATYEFAQAVPDKLEVECTLYRVTVPNHIHMLYAIQGDNSDQQVFDQNAVTREMRFHPPSLWESATRDSSAGVIRLLRSPAGLLFLIIVAFAARSIRQAAILGALFVLAEWLVRPISPFIPLSLSPDFLEAVMALTVAYLAGELLFLPDGRAKWAIVPLLGLVHGLPFVAFPPLYLGGAMIIQIALIGAVSIATVRMPVTWHKLFAVALLLAAGGWFAFLVFG
jgi:hypothetical protein